MAAGGAASVRTPVEEKIGADTATWTQIIQGQYGLKTLGHRLLELLALLMIGAGAGARLKGFGFSVAGGASAFACRRSSRTITRIHSGSADRPLRKSSWMACP